MRKIYKYELLKPEQSFPVPESATPRSVGLDPQGVPCVWCEVADEICHGTINEQPKKLLWIYLVGTGAEIPVPATVYLGRINEGEFVWHVYTN